MKVVVCCVITTERKEIQLIFLILHVLISLSDFHFSKQLATFSAMQ